MILQPAGFYRFCHHQLCLAIDYTPAHQDDHGECHWLALDAYGADGSAWMVSIHGKSAIFPPPVPGSCGSSSPGPNSTRTPSLRRTLRFEPQAFHGAWPDPQRLAGYREA